MEERLQKIIARAGIASRRHAEEMMASGLVTVNGRTITELGTKADPSRDHIKVAGKLIRAEPERIYIALNKPPETVATMSDPEGRRSLRDLLHGVSERVFPAGRMEYHASGLIVLSNDGDLTNRLLQAHKLPQVWQIKLKELLTFAEIESLSRTGGAHITRLKGKNSPWYEMRLTEDREALRRRLMHMGKPIDKMKRIAIGNIELAALEPGKYRELSQSEVAGLIQILDGKKQASGVFRRQRRTRPSKQTHRKHK